MISPARLYTNFIVHFEFSHDALITKISRLKYTLVLDSDDLFLVKALTELVDGYYIDTFQVKNPTFR